MFVSPIDALLRGLKERIRYLEGQELATKFRQRADELSLIGLKEVQDKLREIEQSDHPEDLLGYLERLDAGNLYYHELSPDGWNCLVVTADHDNWPKPWFIAEAKLPENWFDSVSRILVDKTGARFISTLYGDLLRYQPGGASYVSDSNGAISVGSFIGFMTDINAWEVIEAMFKWDSGPCGASRCRQVIGGLIMSRTTVRGQDNWEMERYDFA